ncbi:tRNA (guanosine(37)-N1)-methyltransferase TrmD [Desulfatitalea alkaliphila]|uniref:tRNA (guanine-N(1)-)-methyltransferase n=1 Tax=Desulfatitalea alkaliphila TaxID=2929485 RepID=A0AA41QYN2_9BACT|nr:tRNA (guanosine(37)-N1)-methyltransferase TrmD [Desulfatitalea alkaliphila]MCJ8499442.1 tRNA (guanosine(37)-N1)-methyltransferase TrmD [Desulfatitalea alkaliphila]
MQFVVLTLFPELIQAFWDNGILRRAIAGGAITTEAIAIRDHAAGRHRVTDDRPYGGGCGMVMKPEPLAGALRAARVKAPEALTVLLSPQGAPFDQDMAGRLAQQAGLILVCGRYEGIDERISEQFIELELSIGDVVLTGGEVAAMAVMDAVTRLLPGVLGNEVSAEQDSFRHQRLDHAHYTRPPVFEGREVPEVLLSGHHDRIARWRQADALWRTLVKRPDLLYKGPPSDEETALLGAWYREIQRIIRARGGGGLDTPPGGG